MRDNKSHKIQIIKFYSLLIVGLLLIPIALIFSYLFPGTYQELSLIGKIAVNSLIIYSILFVYFYYKLISSEKMQKVAKYYDRKKAQKKKVQQKKKSSTKIDSMGEINNYSEYKKIVKSRFENNKDILINSLNTSFSYQEKFKLKWFGTKLKMFNYVSFTRKIDERTIKDYSKSCLDYSMNNHKGLPLGFQNGIVSFSVLVSYNVDKAAIDYVRDTPDMHFSSFEMPIIVDLKNKYVYYCKHTPGWGPIFYEYFREHIENYFNHGMLKSNQ